MRYITVVNYVYENCDHISNHTLQTCITVGVSININALFSMSYYVTNIFEFTIKRGNMITSALALYARLIIVYSPSNIRVKLPLIFNYLNDGFTLTPVSLKT